MKIKCFYLSFLRLLTEISCDLFLQLNIIVFLCTLLVRIN